MALIDVMSLELVEHPNTKLLPTEEIQTYLDTNVKPNLSHFTFHSQC